eukprot:EG_transcript_9733
MAEESAAVDVQQNRPPPADAPAAVTVDLSDSDSGIEELFVGEAQSSPAQRHSAPPKIISVDDGEREQRYAGPRWTAEEVQRAAEFRLSRLSLEDIAIAKFVRWALTRPARGSPFAVVAAVEGHLRSVQGVRLLAAWHVVHRLICAKGPYLAAFQPDVPRLVEEHMPHSGPVQVQEQYLKMLLAWEQRSAGGQLFRPQTWQRLEPLLAFRFLRWEPQLVYYAHPERWMDELQSTVNFAARWANHCQEVVRGVVEGMQATGVDTKLPYWAVIDLFCDHSTWFEEAIDAHLPALLRFHASQTDPRFRAMLRSWAAHDRFPTSREAIASAGSPHRDSIQADILAATQKHLEVQQYTLRQAIAVHSRELCQKEGLGRAAVEAREVEDWQYIVKRQEAASKRLKAQERVAAYWEKVAARPRPPPTTADLCAPPKRLCGDPDRRAFSSRVGLWP